MVVKQLGGIQVPCGAAVVLRGMSQYLWGPWCCPPHGPIPVGTKAIADTVSLVARLVTSRRATALFPQDTVDEGQ